MQLYVCTFQRLEDGKLPMRPAKENTIRKPVRKDAPWKVDDWADAYCDLLYRATGYRWRMTMR